jgi:hypothetical protein
MHSRFCEFVDSMYSRGCECNVNVRQVTSGKVQVSKSTISKTGKLTGVAAA